MQVQINLASRPFVELRPFFLRLRLIMGALALAGLALAFSAHLLSAKAERQQQQLDHLRQQTITVQESRLHTEQRMRDPVNSRVLDRAHFLNTLFLRKSFSWTAVMMDLETVLPAGVQVTSIEPQVSPNGNVVIRMRVAGQRGNAVQLVRNLERSQRFLQPRLIGEATQAKETNSAAARPQGIPGQPAGPPGVEFEIAADYNPLPPGQPFRTSQRARQDVSPRGAGSTDMSGIPVIAPARTSTPRTAPSRPGYPPYGVRLKPYHGSAFPTSAAPGGDSQ